MTGPAEMKGERFLYLNPVSPGSHPPQRHAVRLDEHWYFSSGGRLFAIPAQRLAEAGADLGQATEVGLPPGRIRGLVSFKGWLSVALQASGASHTVLLSSQGGPDPEWRTSLEFVGEPSQYCRGPRDKAVFFVANPDDKNQAEPRTIFHSIDGEKWQAFDYLHATDAQHCHSLTCHENHLLVLVGDEHFRHLKIRAFDKRGEIITDPSGRHRQYLGLSDHSLYHTLPGFDGRLFFALDGPTVLVDATGRAVFKDQTPQQCGFQVAAHGCHAALPQMLLFGTWRRSPQTPFPCLYVITPQCVYKYMNQSRPFDDSLAWTGYQHNDATLLNLSGEGDHCFWPGFGCESLYFYLLNRGQAEDLLQDPKSAAGLTPACQGQAPLHLPALLCLD